MNDEQLQSSNKWHELPIEQQLSGYWLAVPDCGQAFDGHAFEIVYVIHDGRIFSVKRIGDSARHSVGAFRFVRRVMFRSIK